MVFLYYENQSGQAVVASNRNPSGMEKASNGKPFQLVFEGEEPAALKRLHELNRDREEQIKTSIWDEIDAENKERSVRLNRLAGKIGLDADGLDDLSTLLGVPVTPVLQSREDEHE